MCRLSGFHWVFIFQSAFLFQIEFILLFAKIIRLYVIWNAEIVEIYVKFQWNLETNLSTCPMGCQRFISFISNIRHMSQSILNKAKIKLCNPIFPQTP